MVQTTGLLRFYPAIYPQAAVGFVLRCFYMDRVEPVGLEQAIVRTVAWFSLFDYPLTGFEIWCWLYAPGQKFTLSDVEKVLAESSWLPGRVCQSDGFFVLGGRNPKDFIKLRQTKFLDAARKFKKLRQAAKFFSLFPFVRAVFACNNLSWHNTTPESDIDLFIVVSPGTIWLSRFLLVTPFRLLGRRPKQTKIDPFCFSFFTTQNNLFLEKLLLSESDPYMYYWLASLVPIFDRGEIQNQLMQKNKWAVDFLPNSFFETTGAEEIGFVSFNFLKFFEKAVKRLQEKLLPLSIKTAANLDSRVIVSDVMLKFHLNDRRAHFREEWKKLYEAYGAG